MFLCLITCLSRSGIGIFSMSQDFLEIWAEVPLIPGLFRSGFFLYLNTALFAFRPVVLETVVTAVYVGLAVPIFGTLSGTFGTFSGTFGTLLGTTFWQLAGNQYQHFTYCARSGCLSLVRFPITLAMDERQLYDFGANVCFA